ncbi:MAG: TonB-dependent receptor [Acidobacteriota bacterium]|nr:TonB-dependent receptor [Acidobacteriota bacterium]
MRRILSLLPRTLFCLLLVTLFSVVANAQFRANLQGTVSDPAGGVVVGATITLTNNETGQTQQTVSSDEGFYRFSNLAPGSYTITAEQSGFQKTEIRDYALRAEETQGADIVLTTGQISETVTVTGETQQLQTENADVSRAISTQEVRGLPQVGRDPYELIRLAPGVFGSGARSGAGGAVSLPNTTGPGGSNNSVFQVENQVPITANGQRVSANNYQIDGVSVNSLGQGGAAVITPNQESVKELRVLSSAYSAEYGRNTGAQILVVSQNGTNEFHGSALFKYNAPNLNAFNRYNGPNNSPRDRVTNRFRQFGGSIGGPVIRERLFFFFSYEGLRASSSNFSTRFVETPQYRQAVINARPGGVTAAIFGAAGIEPRIANVIDVPCPSGFAAGACQRVAGGLDIGSLTGARGQYVRLGNSVGGGLDGIPDIQFVQLSVPNISRGDQFNTRFDYNQGNNTFAVSTYFTRRNDLGANESGASRPLADVRTQPLNSAVTLTFNRVISETIVNEARFNFTRFNFDQLASASETNYGIPRVEVEGLPFDRIRFGAEQGEASPAVFAQNTFEFRDTINVVLGNHALRIGGEIRREQDNNNLVGGARPIYTFSGLFNLANDTPIFEGVNTDPRTGAPGNAQRYFRTGDYAAFIQDDWKARPNLTLNLGLRYEYFTPLKEKRGQLSNLIIDGTDLLNSRVEIVDRLFEGDRNNFSPRLGFAYSPNFGERFGGLLNQNRAVIRGGFGIAYNRVPNVLFNQTRGNPPFFARNNICCGTASEDFGEPFAPLNDNPANPPRILYALGADNSIFGYPINPALAQGIDPVSGGLLNNTVEVYGTPQDFPNAYIYTYSLEMQYNLPIDLVASLGYQGSAGHHFIRILPLNVLSTPNPRFAPVFFIQPDVNTNYNALNASLSRRFAQGLQFNLQYRFSKSIDTLSFEGPGFVTNQTFPQDQSTERGPSDFDVRHYFTTSGLYEIPFFKNRNTVAGKILGGFEISGILTAHSGFPWTPVSGFAVSTPSGQTVSPSRPIAYFGGALDDTSNNAFIRPGGNFPNGNAITNNPGGTQSTPYFLLGNGRPGIGRNSFRGPRYFAVDMSLTKKFGLPSFLRLGEAANFEVRANFFNIFNQLNLAPFGFSSSSTNIYSNTFGQAERGLAGRVVEFQARLRF